MTWRATRAHRLLRRTRSAWLVASQELRSWLGRFVAHHFQEGIAIGKRVLLGRELILSATDGGRIRVGDDTAVGRYGRIVARQGSIGVGQSVFLGDGCFLVSVASIEIGDSTQIAEYVVIRDQDHDCGTARRPFAAGQFQSDPIVIGSDCWIGAKATILRGSRIGDRAVIGAHSVVRGEIPPDCLAVGAPARVVKTFSAATRMQERVRQAEDVRSDVAA